jgi:hypothetical protein
MTSIAELKGEIEQQWGENPIAPLCVQIIDFMAHQPNDQLRMLTFLSFSNGIGLPAPTEAVVRAVFLLTSSSVHALDARLLFIDDHDQEYEIDKADIKEAEQEGGLIHPGSGEMIPDYEDKVLPYFVPSDRFIEAKAAG